MKTETTKNPIRRTLKTKVRMALENSMCANRFANLVKTRRDSMISEVVGRVKLEGLSIEEATAFANHPATFQMHLDDRREIDYQHIAMRRKEFKRRYRKQDITGFVRSGDFQVKTVSYEM